jgi:predicted HD superfamily hydrolase involved in NAD metabolism
MLTRARALARAHLGEESYAHCERVAATAKLLAERHGVDPDQAELAGLLHDFSRDEDEEDLLDGADSMGLTVLPVERENPYLLHARVGAARLAAGMPDLPEPVRSAVAAHTVGAVPMSALDKVIYLADMIEPARVYDGVESLRVSCERDSLDECFRRAYARSVEHVRAGGRPLHPLTADVMRAIEDETGRAFDPSAVA